MDDGLLRLKQHLPIVPPVIDVKTKNLITRITERITENIGAFNMWKFFGIGTVKED